MIAALRAELRRLAEHIDATDTSGPDGSTFDTRAAHALLGDFNTLPCTLCDGDTYPHDRVVGQASGPHGVILHDDEIAHAECLAAARRVR